VADLAAGTGDEDDGFAHAVEILSAEGVGAAVVTPPAIRVLPRVSRIAADGAAARVGPLI
jgi:hypothetical protein